MQQKNADSKIESTLSFYLLKIVIYLAIIESTGGSISCFYWFYKIFSEMTSFPRPVFFAWYRAWSDASYI